MKTNGVVDVYIQVFLISALVGGEWSTSRPGPLYPRGKSPRFPLGRRLSGPQKLSGRRGEEKNLTSTGTRTPTSRPSRPSQSLYRLRYPGSHYDEEFFRKFLSKYFVILYTDMLTLNLTALKMTLFLQGSHSKNVCVTGILLVGCRLWQINAGNMSSIYYDRNSAKHKFILRSV
jgi:hypothetical protein